MTHEAPDPARKRALERAIASDVFNTEAWTIYADFLSSSGSVLGQRIALELALEQAPPRLAKQLAHQCRTLDQKHRREWIGTSLSKLMRSRGFDVGTKLEWRYGFIFAAALRGRKAKRKRPLATILRTLLASPASRFLRELTLARGRSDDPREFARAFEVLAHTDLPQTLEVLRLQATRWRKSAPSEPIDLAQLSKLGARLSGLRRLRLSLPSQGDALVGELAEAPWLERLEALAITGSSMSDLGAECMLAARSRFWALGRIDLSANHLSPYMVDELMHTFPNMHDSDRDRLSLYWTGY